MAYRDVIRQEAVTLIDSDFSGKQSRGWEDSRWRVPPDLSRPSPSYFNHVPFPSLGDFLPPGQHSISSSPSPPPFYHPSPSALPSHYLFSFPPLPFRPRLLAPTSLRSISSSHPPYTFVYHRIPSTGPMTRVNINYGSFTSLISVPSLEDDKTTSSSSFPSPALPSSLRPCPPVNPSPDFPSPLPLPLTPLPLRTKLSFRFPLPPLIAKYRHLLANCNSQLASKLI